MNQEQTSVKELRRRLNREELSEAVELADLVFREPGQPSMGDSFPRIFDPAMDLSLGIAQDGRLVSFIGFVPQRVRIGSSTISACALGSVCTHPDYRGQGHASVLLSEAFHQAEEMDAAIMLVSGTRSLYRRNGCHAFGSVRRYRLSRQNNCRAPLSAGMTVRSLLPEDWFRLQELAEGKPAGYSRSIADLAQELRSEAVAAMYGFHHDVYVAEDNGGLAAYAVIASGPIPQDSDLEPFVVDWGGKASVVLPLLRETMNRMDFSTMLLFVSDHERRMMKLLEGQPYTSSHNQGTIRIMNMPLLWEQLGSYFAERAAAAGLIVPVWEVESLPSGEYALQLDGRPITLSSRDWTLLLFDGPDAEPDDGPDAFVLRQSAIAASDLAEAKDDGSEAAAGRHLPFTDSQAELLRVFFPLPFPYTAGLSYI